MEAQQMIDLAIVKKFFTEDAEFRKAITSIYPEFNLDAMQKGIESSQKKIVSDFTHDLTLYAECTDNSPMRVEIQAKYKSIEINALVQKIFWFETFKRAGTEFQVNGKTYIFVCLDDFEVSKRFHV